MEIIINKKDFLQALHTAHSIIEKRNVIDELANVKLSAINGDLIVGATDIDLYLNQKITAEILKEGVTTVTSNLMLDIVKKISDETIKLRQNPGATKLEVITNNAKFNLVTLKADKFPSMEKLTDDSNFTVKAKNLSKLLDYTSYAASKEETRYNLNGIFIEQIEGVICAAATDGHRLSCAKTNSINHLGQFEFILPKKAAAELQKILKQVDGDTEVKLIFDQSLIRVTLLNYDFLSKLIDATFPDYKNFIPTENDNILQINTRLFEYAVERMASVTSGQFRTIKLNLEADCIIINANGENTGEAHEKIPFNDDKNEFAKYEGNPLKISLNPKYISDTLSRIDLNNITVKFNNTPGPVMLEANQDGIEASFVIMPMKV